MNFEDLWGVGGACGDEGYGYDEWVELFVDVDADVGCYFRGVGYDCDGLLVLYASVLVYPF